MVADEGVTGLSHPDAGHIARTQVLDENRRVGSLDLDLTLTPRVSLIVTSSTSALYSSSMPENRAGRIMCL